MKKNNIPVFANSLRLSCLLIPARIRFPFTALSRNAGVYTWPDGQQLEGVFKKDAPVKGYLTSSGSLVPPPPPLPVSFCMSLFRVLPRPLLTLFPFLRGLFPHSSGRRSKVYFEDGCRTIWFGQLAEPVSTGKGLGSWLKKKSLFVRRLSTQS
jgi:hypothetical protein